jgi:hypothetical protein
MGMPLGFASNGLCLAATPSAPSFQGDGAQPGTPGCRGLRKRDHIGSRAACGVRDDEEKCRASGCRWRVPGVNKRLNHRKHPRQKTTESLSKELIPACQTSPILPRTHLQTGRDHEASLSGGGSVPGVGFRKTSHLWRSVTLPPALPVCFLFRPLADRGRTGQNGAAIRGTFLRVMPEGSSSPFIERRAALRP